MRERPLSITIAGWFILTIGILSIIKGLVSGVPSTAVGPGDFTKANWCLELLIAGLLLAIFSVYILKGKAWARTGIVITLALDLLRAIFLDWPDSRFFFPVDIFLDLLVLTVLYQPRSHAFFHGNGEPPPLTYQAGTALCYSVITLFLVPVIALPANFSLMELQDLCKLLLVAFILVVIYGIGNAFGVVLNPRRDVGAMLIIAAVASLIFCIGVFFRRAGGFGVALRGGDPVPNVNLWISCVVTVILVTLGVSLIRRSRVAAEVSPTLIVESTDVTGAV